MRNYKREYWRKVYRQILKILAVRQLTPTELTRFLQAWEMILKSE